jgi:CubicO group peptidase (beta-lactamase class C family)
MFTHKKLTRRKKWIVGIVALLAIGLLAVAYPRVHGARNAFATALTPYPVPAENPSLQEAYRFLDKGANTDAFVALKGDQLLASWGETALPINTHSVRKSILSTLYGIAIAKGLIDIGLTLAELGIDDSKVPLTEVEKSATIRDLLTSRSGIYIEAAGETQGMKDGRPQRGSHQPGESFYYNNWGFNVLGVIFEKQTKLSIGEALYQWIAKPTGMRTFRPEHVIYTHPDYTEHRQFVIFMTAEDLARLGALFLRAGNWQGKQVVPAAWVRESTTPYSEIDDKEPFDQYGYLWWLDKDENTFWADGWGGQFMIIDRAHDLVIVSRNDTGRSLLQIGFFHLSGRDGSRGNHQQLHRLMISATAAGPGRPKDLTTRSTN